MQSGFRTVRCPGCGAAGRPDAPWCTQCYRDLSGDLSEDARADLSADLSGAGAPEPAVVRLGSTPGSAPTGGGAGSPGWPCGTCGRRNELASPACSACGAPFLAGLRGGGVPGPVAAGLVTLSPGRRVLLALVLAGGLTGVLLLATVLLDALLGGLLPG